MQEKIGRYKILRKIGRGGMGDVFRALDPALGKIVAIKILRPFEAMIDVVGYDRLSEIFITEAETMSFLADPFVVDILDTGRDENGRPYFVMDFFCNNLGRMIGESFKMEKRSRTIRPDKVKDYGSQLLTGLSHIHRHNVVHRDIKPYNILVTDDEKLRLLDFGMALVDDISFTGLEHVQIGSPFYTAPEQNIDPANVDGRADLYSVGVLLYRMLTGEFPTMREFSLSRIDRKFDRLWDDFFVRALNIQPGDRFQTAAEMAVELGQLRVSSGHIMSVKEGGRNNSENQGVSLRNEPVNVCGEKALSRFGLDEMQQLAKPVTNDFVDSGNGTLIDRSTGLAWDVMGSEKELDYGEAQAYIDQLNTMKFADIDFWRLPTVPELLSLLESDSRFSGKPDKPRTGWLWSSDLHGKQDAWYVNLEMGYVDWQDVTCRNYVKAVCGQAP